MNSTKRHDPTKADRHEPIYVQSHVTNANRDATTRTSVASPAQAAKAAAAASGSLLKTACFPPGSLTYLPRPLCKSPLPHCMGNQTSSLVLAPQAHFPHALSARYTRARTVTLRLEPCFWSHSHPDPLEIRDVATNLTMFRVPTTTERTSCSKRLLDMYNAPVATLTTLERVGTSITSTIAPVHRHSTERTCSVETKLLDGKTQIAVQASWGDHNRISCAADWSDLHNVDFWLEHEHHTNPGGRIARIRRDPLVNHDGGRCYLLEIAPGVDIALLLLICAAIDEAVAPHLPTRDHDRHKGATAKRRTSRLEIAVPSLRRSDAVPVPV